MIFSFLNWSCNLHIRKSKLYVSSQLIEFFFYTRIELIGYAPWPDREKDEKKNNHKIKYVEIPHNFRCIMEMAHTCQIVFDFTG